tara:strand:- start:49 stop:486 length:438 start_codon:yes stop_codon:yes gene_type:complete
MKKAEADAIWDEVKITKEATIFFNKRSLNDVVDGRVPYQNKESNLVMIDEKRGKLKKNVFAHKGEKGISFKIFKDKYTEEPKEDGDIYGPLEYERCNTPDKMLGQIRYLTGFDWCTAEIIDQFIHMVEAVHVGLTGEVLYQGEGR